MADESTTDVHPTKKPARERAAHPVGQTAAATVLSALLVGGGGFLVRAKDLERVEQRQDAAERDNRENRQSIIEMRAEARHQNESIQRIERGIDAINAKLDNLRERERVSGPGPR